MNKPFTNKGITSENIEEQKLQEFVNKLTNPKILLSFEEIERFMKPYENLRGNEFYNPYYHLPFYQFLSEYIAKKYNVKKDSPEMRKFLEQMMIDLVLWKPPLKNFNGYLIDVSNFPDSKTSILKFDNT
jgi:uncharacterized protein Usg